MTVHFSHDEFAIRRDAATAVLKQRGLDGILLFAQESMYWLTGYDSFGFCFFQCLVLTADGRIALMTRSADLRQAQHTSIIEDIRVWVDSGNAGPAVELKAMLSDLGLANARLGAEFETQGLTAKSYRDIDSGLEGFVRLEDGSDIFAKLRAVKSKAEIAYVRKAASLADAAYERALELVGPGAAEGHILSTLQGTIFEGGGDYPGNEFIIGSGPDALLCRYRSGRRKLDKNDQLTLEWAGSYRHYHAALMRTVIIGKPKRRHIELHSAALAALEAVEEVMRPGHSFGDVFDAHAAVMDERGLSKHRLNACGYSLGARFTPSWMDMPMFYRANPAMIVPDMTLFAHMIIMDSDSQTAMCVGRTYLTTEGAPEALSRLSLDLPIKG